ncbi:MmcQ/YjbR family DNA-binding protein [Noviluteimonas gilva]|uniref:MmcQ/YjbR family DNA-binding protein n=1 Tax=Noviluteimonas gilva TaxID=2682097 RepID=A0A7C9HZD5_9GAMM|nr:MmcQ/YjbR family DNA-binding protein [Lysobacter gilvus]MUV14754.1 hypothetical protein [Lysobacter gilvus]
MKFEQVRAEALSLAEVTQAPHFDFASFRVGGKIFMTVPPDEKHVHLFVAEEDRELALALHPGFAEKLMWGTRVAGLRIALHEAKPDIVLQLVHKAWANKAPKRLSR